MPHRPKPFAAFCLALMAIFLCALNALAQTGPKIGDTGSLSGTITQITTEFLLLQPATGTPQRLWFKWISPAGAIDDRSVQPMVATLKSGDTVEAQWSFDGQRRLESINLAAALASQTSAAQESNKTLATPLDKSPAPAAPAATVPEPASPGASTAEQNPGISTGDRVNALLDNLIATGERLMELPLFLLLAAFGLTTAAVVFAMDKLSKKGRPRLNRIVAISAVTTALLGAVVLIDRKLSRMQNEIQELRIRASTTYIVPSIAPAVTATLPVAPAIPQAGTPHFASVASAAAKSNAALPPTITLASPGKRTALFFDQAKTQNTLTQQFGNATIKPTIYDAATDIVAVHLSSPLAQAYLAIVDLHNPAVEIKFGFNLDTKTLTSQFARDNDCVVAINGEAGASPGPRSGLGVWRGFMVQQGKILLREDPSIPRPYLSFDPQNRATFTPLAAKDRTLPAAPYNIIWGRVDALLNGTVQDIDPNNRQPRTAMALDQDNSHLYLFVVDGRQPRYSMGFTRGEVARFLQAFGATNAMLCDEGGSSCIYLKQIGGIANIPSDNQGQERPTYTHFGIAMKK